MLISRFAMELIFAGLTMVFGIAVCLGSMEYGISWGDSGPQPGYFPFYVGLILAGASLVNFGTALFRHRGSVPFIDREQAKRLLSFFVPVVAFVAVTVVLGLYVGTALYLCLVMWLQGGYRLLPSVAVGLGVSVAFYVVFEMWFRVPLLKGPLEPLLGIY